jgi:plastocyanin
LFRWEKNSSGKSAIAQTNFSNVYIAQEAASLADKAFSPNPLEASIITTVIWTNQDSEEHTMTLGDAATGVALFSSTMPSRGMQFKYAFEGAGNFSYYCSLQPIWWTQ